MIDVLNYDWPGCLMPALKPGKMTTTEVSVRRYLFLHSAIMFLLTSFQGTDIFVKSSFLIHSPKATLSSRPRRGQTPSPPTTSRSTLTDSSLHSGFLPLYLRCFMHQSLY